MSYYKWLEELALDPNAQQEDIDELGFWYEENGIDFWNEEYFDIDGFHKLYPIYNQVGEDDFIWQRYEIRWDEK